MGAVSTRQQDLTRCLPVTLIWINWIKLETGDVWGKISLYYNRGREKREDDSPCSSARVLDSPALEVGMAFWTKGRKASWNSTTGQCWQSNTDRHSFASPQTGRPADCRRGKPPWPASDLLCSAKEREGGGQRLGLKEAAMRGGCHGPMVTAWQARSRACRMNSFCPGLLSSQSLKLDPLPIHGRQTSDSLPVKFSDW